MKDLSKWNIAHAILLIIGGINVWITGDSSAIYLAGAGSFIILLVIAYPEWSRLRPWGGYANFITLIRLLLLLATYFFHEKQVLFVMLLTSISLDAIDGWVARKTGSSSEFGAYFDIETDAFFTLILTTVIYTSNWSGSWLIHFGMLRYYYVFLKFLLKWHKKKEARVNVVRYVAIAVFIMYFSPFVTQENLYQPLLYTGSALLLFSFGYSFFLLAKSREKS